MRNLAALEGKVTKEEDDDNNSLFSSKERKEHDVLEELHTTQLAGRKWLSKSC